MSSTSTAMTSSPANTAPASTAPSSPPPPSDVDIKPSPDPPSEDFEARYIRLTNLLQKSTVYTSMLKRDMDAAKLVAKSKSAAAPPPAKRAKRSHAHAAHDNEDEGRFRQPALITGATLKDYQLEGVEWMIGLHQNGISGILADEMGLGKTLQTIAFNAHLREQNVRGAFMVVCPLSVLWNWKEEFAKFAPDIPVCVYHGTPAERAEMRRTVLRPVVYEDDVKEEDEGEVVEVKSTKKRGKTTKAAKKGKGAKGARRSGRFRKAPTPTPSASSSSEQEDHSPPSQLPNPTRPTRSTQPPSHFPVLLTTYEILIKDRAHLARLSAPAFSYIVVDEGHRLKNMDCRLMKEIKRLESGGRVVLTGTPLHNNLAELWSLLNFILPDIFHDLDAFQEMFNLSTMQSMLSSERSSSLINTLHGILKPFLLRRVKADVLSSEGWFDEKTKSASENGNGGLPPKKEYVLWAPLSVRQREVYDQVLSGGLRRFLIGDKHKDKHQRTAKVVVDVDAPRKLRGAGKGRKRRRYEVEGDSEDDDRYFERLERGEKGDEDERVRMEEREEAEDVDEIGRAYQYRSTLKQVNNMKLQNTVMQLRKVCSHPFLFDWPLDPGTRQQVVDAQLVRASGKMMVLERLLEPLFERGHKVLLFSQFVTMLDIIEAWATEFKRWRICRIDGSTPPLERRAQMETFQTAGEARDAPRLFLLSTRAGGLGVNLTAADTVIFYDQDWNPQMDIQAQDRAHRIGQTRPVLIFRLVSAHTVEEKIMHRATEKRKLEALIIAKGKFKAPTAAGRGKQETMAEMAAALMKLEGEKIEVVSGGGGEVLSDRDLEVLLDRRPEVFSERGKGWSREKEKERVGGGGEGGEGEAKTAFAVYEGREDEGDDVLAGLMGEVE